MTLQILSAFIPCQIDYGKVFERVVISLIRALIPDIFQSTWQLRGNIGNDMIEKLEKVQDEHGWYRYRYREVAVEGNVVSIFISSNALNSWMQNIIEQNFYGKFSICHVLQIMM